MFKKATLTVVVLLFSSSLLSAQAPPMKGGGLCASGGDSPLTTTFVWEGNGGAEVVPVPFDALPDISGTFVLSTIPDGSTIIKAYYAITGWQEDLVYASGTFADSSLGTILPTVCDTSNIYYYMSFYRWDVTPHVTGDGSYSFSGSNLRESYLAYLVVVYENSSSPPVRIAVNDGAESLQYASSTSLFSGFTAGNGTIKIVTQAGDWTGTAEMIEFNGEILAGPGNIFEGNLGPYADYHEFDLTNVQSEDSLTITVDEDQIGIHLAVLIGTSGTDVSLEGSGVDLPTEFALSSNRPNPFNASTVIEYQLPQASEVTLEVYNLLGAKVATLVNEAEEAGCKSVTWDASEVASGLYFYKLSAGDYIETKRMMLLK